MAAPQQVADVAFATCYVVVVLSKSGSTFMTTVFVLFHTHDLGDGETDDKLIGVYSSQADAQQAQARTVLPNGFRDQPGGFVIDPYELGKDHWNTGYVTVITGRPLARGQQD